MLSRYSGDVLSGQAHKATFPAEGNRFLCCLEVRYTLEGARQTFHVERVTRALFGLVWQHEYQQAE